jgi:hypothetical protein
MDVVCENKRLYDKPGANRVIQGGAQAFITT